MAEMKAEHAKLVLSLWWVAQSTLKKYLTREACLYALAVNWSPNISRWERVFAVFLGDLFKPKLFLKVLFRALVHNEQECSRNKTVGSFSEWLITHGQYSGGVIMHKVPLAVS